MVCYLRKENYIVKGCLWENVYLNDKTSFLPFTCSLVCKYDIRKLFLLFTRISIVYILPMLYSNDINCIVFFLVAFIVYMVIMLVKDM